MNGIFSISQRARQRTRILNNSSVTKCLVDQLNRTSEGQTFPQVQGEEKSNLHDQCILEKKIARGERLDEYVRSKVDVNTPHIRWKIFRNQMRVDEYVVIMLRGLFIVYIQRAEKKTRNKR